MTAETIYALSSGSPPAAIAVVRISGPKADAALFALAGRLPPPRSASLVSLREGDTLLDRALALRFPGPASATGENLVELHLHGGRAVVAAVTSSLARMDGLRGAEPGEFTRRAFENGRIDLAEAEGLADLLQAETESQRRAAIAWASGALTRRIRAWQDRLVMLSALLEAVLDFSDEGEVGETIPSAWADELAGLRREIETALAAPSAERLRDGVRVVIAGPPNAGKSSLLNALIGREAAITSHIPGTTRDLVEAPMALAGTPFLMIDTAGLRISEDEVESIGIARARSSLETADIILWLGEVEEAADDPRIVIVRAKSDLHPDPRPGSVSVSARTGEGLSQLVAVLLDRSRTILPVPGEIAMNRRHRDALANALLAMDEASAIADPLICAELLRQARAELDQVIGGAGVDAMLDALFGRFCIGK